MRDHDPSASNSGKREDYSSKNAMVAWFRQSRLYQVGPYHL